MELKVLGSSSSGNCYILDNGNEALIIEAGIRFLEVKKALGFNLRKVVGCLITHQHNDHAKYIKTMVDNGFFTLALPEVWTAKGVWGSRSKAIEPGKGYKFGNFKVLPFAASHDVPCVGYLITHSDCGKIMFLTDSCSCDYRFSGLNQVLIECNYSDKKLVEAINDGRTLLSQRERLLTSHLELNACKNFLADNDLTDVQNIVLLHLSDNNSDEPFFVSEIERLTGKVVYAARPGLTLNINRI
ncbi:MAG: MBL fold metallo-hydrolase [Lachnospiraceae bacterium]|nr:MBL fold metallo-hydrolase [Lachnospiraceae bacterium]